MEDSEVEKRRARRSVNETLVRFEGENFSIYSKLYDINQYGAFVATHYLLDPGTDITFSLIGGSGDAQMRKARVVHSSCSKVLEGKPILGLGIEFVKEA